MPDESVRDRVVDGAAQQLEMASEAARGAREQLWMFQDMAAALTPDEVCALLKRTRGAEDAPLQVQFVIAKKFWTRNE